MKLRTIAALLVAAGIASGCILSNHTAQTRNSSSLVSFLYPNGDTLPAHDAMPELRVPLRVGLAFLPSQSSFGAAQLDAAHKQELLERIRQRFSDRKFVSEIVIIPDYYLATSKGFAGLEGVQRLYDIDLMALVSYDQVTYTEDNKWSLGYLTIVGAYVVKGTINDTTTLVDLAVVDPKSRSLVLRAGGTDTHHQTSTLVDVRHDARIASADSFDAATGQMIGNFGGALTAFETAVHEGRANVHVTARNGGGGSITGWEALLLFAVLGIGGVRPRRRGH